MAKFSIGEIAVCIVGINTGECEIVSGEYVYMGRNGYEVIFPNSPCKSSYSKRGEWFCLTPELRKKQPPQELSTWKQVQKDTNWNPVRVTA